MRCLAVKNLANLDISTLTKKVDELTKVVYSLEKGIATLFASTQHVERSLEVENLIRSNEDINAVTELSRIMKALNSLGLTARDLENLSSIGSSTNSGGCQCDAEILNDLKTKVDAIANFFSLVE